MDKPISLMLETPAELFNGLGHPARLAILEVLRSGEVCVCHIQAVLNLRQAYASQHLNVLRQAKLVTSRKDGTRVYYQLSSPDLMKIVDQARMFLLAQGYLLQPDLYQMVELVHPDCNCPQCSGEPSC